MDAPVSDTLYYYTATVPTDAYPEVLAHARGMISMRLKAEVEKDGRILEGEPTIAQRLVEVPAGIDEDGLHYDARSYWSLKGSAWGSLPVS